ncbi:putative lipoxygenase 6 [Iris pallida]|uniref:Lipoxygenase n=1 Tax=Iris pallida TaxID=29817 RepID=A0AAX6G4C4_IRIPA|nr:putative lipoxygenase 6 [Iris pallida]
MKLVMGAPVRKFKVRAAVTVRRKSKEDLKGALANQWDAISDKVGRSVVLELVSNEISPITKRPKTSRRAVLRDWYEKKNVKGERVVYTAEFMIDSDFGTPGAVTVTNRHQKEFFLESIVIEGEGFPSGHKIHFPCNSWVQSTKDLPTKRVFFSNKPYLPSETPPGIKVLREKELEELRGDRKGVRKRSDRVYDYDIYNDLGNPDKAREFARPILGGKIPYPRRCRTGRPPTDTNIDCESRVEKPHPMYVPRDEAFEELKQDAFLAGRLKAVLHNLIPSLIATISNDSHDFLGFHDIDSLYKEGLLLKLGLQDHLLHKIPMVRRLQESSHGLLRYDTPSILSKDKFAWLRDDEFARQALAGINPINIERVRVFPPVSKLDPKVYGPPESAITEDHITGQLEGMSVQQAMDAGKLFMLDYHDIYLPFIGRINEMHGRRAYGTRAIFFLTQLGTLRPVAIELSLPPTKSGPGSRRVLTPPCDATTNWLWQLAKAHVGSNDAGVHQLVNHWLRTHATMEPFILAAHRHLSAMHPLYKLLEPHMRYTLEINALARQSLINAEGVIEACFTPGPCCLEISAAFYRDYWRFDLEGLPADLIRRGMAVEDPSQPHGLRLLISDYPYANDGLLIWSAIQRYVESYVQIYYPNPAVVQSDSELQTWYTESIHIGHGDHRYASWWPPLNTPSDLAHILTTVIWLASAQHAALNFGQYPLGGYVPNRPPLMRKLVPDPDGDGDEDRAVFESFLSDPHKYFLSAMPGVLSATKFMAVVDTLSTHSPDEEYLGERQLEDTWTDDAEAKRVFKEFQERMVKVEEEISIRNADPGYRNRCGAGRAAVRAADTDIGAGSDGEGSAQQCVYMSNSSW